MKKEFEEYQLIHNYMYPDESLKLWINEDNFTNPFIDNWDLLMDAIEKIENDGCHVHLITRNNVYFIKIQAFSEHGAMLQDISANRFKDRTSKKELIYRAILKYIQWYNTIQE